MIAKCVVKEIIVFLHRKENIKLSFIEETNKIIYLNLKKRRQTNYELMKIFNFFP